jgi:hypothetical protein
MVGAAFESRGVGSLAAWAAVDKNNSVVKIARNVVKCHPVEMFDSLPTNLSQVHRVAKEKFKRFRAINSNAARYDVFQRADDSLDLAADIQVDAEPSLAFSVRAPVLF